MSISGLISRGKVGRILAVMLVFSSILTQTAHAEDFSVAETDTISYDNHYGESETGESITKESTTKDDTIETVVSEDKTTENSNLNTNSGSHISETADYGWNYAYFGTGTYGKESGYKGSIKENELRLYALNGEGKLNGPSVDGLIFYYYAVPAGKNFTLKAKCHVNEWTYSGSQSGFGIGALDRIGSSTSSAWNNMVTAQISRYVYNNSINKSVTMNMGVCSLAKYGLTRENEAELMSDETSGEAVKKYRTVVTAPLDMAANSMPSANYNIIGNSIAEVHKYNPDRCGVKSETNPNGYDPIEVPGTISDQLRCDFILTIDKNNSGYYVSYEDENGVKNTKRNPVPEKDPLLSYDQDYVYVGFFAARNVDVTFSDAELSIRNPEEDEPAKAVEPNYMDLTLRNMSTPYSNSNDYRMIIMANWDGKYVYRDKYGNKIGEGTVKADEYVYLPQVILEPGENKLRIEFEPDKDFHYGYDEYHPLNYYNRLRSYEVTTKTFTIQYNSYESLGEYIYVSPEGTENGKGTKEEPFDLVTATRYVQPGQTIKMAGGVYLFEANEAITIYRGNNGEPGKYIRLEGNPDDNNRTIIDFNKKGKGIRFAGNFWLVKDIDVRNTANGNSGLRISGNYCICDGVRTYNNGNTGLTIDRHTSTDPSGSDFWPHDNIVRNCLSYENADIGYEDADGFSAKISVGKNNVFDNCVSHHNADDGWDLYAKKESGRIGSVRINNCVAYCNGYVHENGKLVVAGNGNGFKLGGESLKGGHILTNSYSFYNKAAGIDSNSCPDIKIYNNVSFDNGTSNVAFYTQALATDYEAKKIVSFRKDIKLNQYENLNAKQDNKEAYNNSTDFYWDNEKQKSLNTDGVEFKEEYFKSLSFDPEKDEIARNADGTINMRGFLEFVDDIDDMVGFELTKREMEDPVIYPDKKDEDPKNPSGDDPENPGGEDPENPGGEDPETPGGDDPENPGGEQPDSVSINMVTKQLVDVKQYVDITGAKGKVKYVIEDRLQRKYASVNGKGILKGKKATGRIKVSVYDVVKREQTLLGSFEILNEAPNIKTKKLFENQQISLTELLEITENKVAKVIVTKGDVEYRNGMLYTKGKGNSKLLIEINGVIYKMTVKVKSK